MNPIIPKLVMYYARIVPVLLVVWASIVPVGSLWARSHKAENQAVIRVGVYNDAHIDGVELYDAEHQAATLFAEAGVKITWLDNSHKQRSVRCQPGNSSAEFFLRIVFANGTMPQGSVADALGRSMIPPAGYGYVPCGTASVFYDRVIAFASVWASHSPEILGDAMAHELGHLLLGNRHSRQGIMKALWTFRDLDLARRGQLQFSNEQLVALQRIVQSLPRNSPTMAVAKH